MRCCIDINFFVFASEYTIRRICGPGSSVSIATELLAGWSGIESWWGRDILPLQTSLWAHPASCKMGTRSFPGVKCGRGVLLTTHFPSIVPRSWKSKAIPLPALWANTGACNGITLPFSFYTVYSDTSAE